MSDEDEGDKLMDNGERVSIGAKRSLEHFVDISEFHLNFVFTHCLNSWIIY